MLELFNIESINGDTSKAGSRGLNTAFITEVETTETSKCKFRFTPKPDDRRGGGDIYVVTESRAVVTAAMNASAVAKAITLSTYPDNDATKTPVPKVYLSEEIVQCYPNTRSDRTLAWIVNNQRGWRHKRHLVAHYWIDIIDVIGTSSSTTTSTSTTSTTSTSTSTTSTSTTSTTTT